ncbi:MAG TPA: hypothetical protein VKV23_09055 [Acidimicrobiales bacterium]|nr:hypothetical protein [Acidimicrobiales bacterium]
MTWALERAETKKRTWRSRQAERKSSGHLAESARPNIRDSGVRVLAWAVSSGDLFW